MARHYKENPFDYLTMTDEHEMSRSEYQVEEYIQPDSYYFMEGYRLLDKAPKFDLTYALRSIMPKDVFNSDAPNWINNVYDVVTEINKINRYPFTVANNIVKLSAGKGATINIVYKEKENPNPINVNGTMVNESKVIVEAGGKTFNFSKDVNITKLHDLVMVYQFANNNLSKQNENIVNLHKLCEKTLTDLQNGNIKDIDIDYSKYLTKGLMEKINNQTELEAFKLSLITNGVMPPETDTFKYPKNLDNLKTFTTKISKTYKVEKKLFNKTTKHVEKLAQKLNDKFENENKNELTN